MILFVSGSTMLGADSDLAFSGEQGPRGFSRRTEGVYPKQERDQLDFLAASPEDRPRNRSSMQAFNESLPVISNGRSPSGS